jgi:hypothetical protein
MLMNHWQSSGPENVHSNVTHNEAKVTRCASVLQPRIFHKSSVSKLRYLWSEQSMEFVYHGQQCKIITLTPSNMHTEYMMHVGDQL